MFDRSWISVFSLTGAGPLLLVAGCGGGGGGLNLKAPDSAPSQTVSELAPGSPASSQASTPAPLGVHTEFDGEGHQGSCRYHLRHECVEQLGASCKAVRFRRFAR